MSSTMILTFPHQDDVAVTSDVIMAIQPRLDDAEGDHTDPLHALAIAQVSGTHVVETKVELDAIIDEILFRTERDEVDFGSRAGLRQGVLVLKALQARR